MGQLFIRIVLANSTPAEIPRIAGYFRQATVIFDAAKRQIMAHCTPECENFISNLPPSWTLGLEYYYRRGQRFFFRNNKGQRFIMFVSPEGAEMMKRQLRRGPVLLEL